MAHGAAGAPAPYRGSAMATKNVRVRITPRPERAGVPRGGGQSPACDARPGGPRQVRPQALRSGHGVGDRDGVRARRRGGSRDSRLLDGGNTRYLPCMEASLSDAALVARCRTGDESAWAELVNRFSRYVYAIATQGFGLRADDAEDVFQEVFARTFQHLERLRDDEAIRPWIAQLTRRLSIDHIRASSREQLSDEDIEPSGLDETFDRLDEALTVRESLGELSETCQEILDRFFARDESYQTIGEVLEIPAGTIASRISRCLAKLREVFEGRNSSPEPS
jgi:RNA polymerase sigma factor (sigma-70 family)